MGLKLDGCYAPARRVCGGLQGPADRSAQFWCDGAGAAGRRLPGFGLIYDIHIDDDGLVRQLITAENISDEVMRDNRENRTVPVEIGVLALGYEENGQVAHLLPPGRR